MVQVTWGLTDEVGVKVSGGQQKPRAALLTSSPLAFCTDRSSLDTIWRTAFTNMS